MLTTRTLRSTAFPIFGFIVAAALLLLPACAQDQPEAPRAVRLMTMVRGWIDPPEAVDLRPYDEKVIKAAGP